jgi:hypothetical protein
VDRLAHKAIAAETLFGERSIDLVGEAQWIVAVILGTGHSGFPRLFISTNEVVAYAPGDGRLAEVSCRVKS